MGCRVLDGRRILITGASSGIGRALACALVRYRPVLMLTGRRSERLAQLNRQLAAADSTVYTLAGDITRPEFRQQLAGACQSQMGGLDILVNNAGVGAHGPFADSSSSRLHHIMEVNFFAAAELIRATLPLLQSGCQPAIVNVGSVLGHRAVPGKSEYCASKFALHGFSDSLRAELAPRGIDVLHVCPSTTETEFFDQLIGGRVPGARRRGMAPDVVARHMIRALQKRRSEIVLSPSGKLLVWIDRLWPSLANWLVARLA
jgi:short-subunit dehydrogenase